MNTFNSNQDGAEEGVISTSCLHNCGGGRCLLKVHVKNGKITRIETDNGADPQLRACARGRAYRQRFYSPDRLKYPLRRTGERGEGKFERISWDDALDTVADNLLRVKAERGNSAILPLGGSGNTGGTVHGPAPVFRMLNSFGGYTGVWGVDSWEGTMFASLATYGTQNTGNSADDFLSSRMIILWGWNPAETGQGPSQSTNRYLAQARDRGTRILAVDPRYTDSAALFAKQWIPIRPGTDTAMLIAMAHVIITENLQDQAFIDKYTVGFERYREYVIGTADDLPKTPQWAESITGVPADTITNLAREYAQVKPAALVLGWAPARSAMGEQCARAANVLTAITGNIGVHGGHACGMRYVPSGTGKLRGRKPSESRNPVERGTPPIKNALWRLEEAFVPGASRIHGNRIFDAILEGKAGGYPADIKMVYVVASNVLNQRNNISKAVKAMKSVQFVVVHEQFMTPTARYADIVLPINTFMERQDITSGPEALLYLPCVVDSEYESRTDLAICRDLAARLGIPEAISNQSEDDLLKKAFVRKNMDSDGLKREGVIKRRRSQPVVAFEAQVNDPGQNPFPTVSGKIEIYSEQIAEMRDPLLPPIPTYISPGENYDDPLAEHYPLQLITPHYKLRTHSIHFNDGWLNDLESQSVWINAADAKDRGIADGDLVDVYNDRGRVCIPAKVTARIMPGVVNIYQGAWYTPDENGVDHGGNANMLTKDDHSPGGAYSFNTALVQVEPACQP